ncbi:MAG: hypothetical protein ACM3X9_09690 [Bacillota bacterium]
MYILFLLLAAFLLLSIFSTNWPVKLYHHYFLQKLAGILETVPERYGFFFSGMYSQIQTIYRNKPLKIRFIEGSVDSLRTGSGLEIRTIVPSGAVLEFYRPRRNKREWGDFQRFLTGEQSIDSQWFILTNDPVSAGLFWNSFHLQDLLNYPWLEQLLINREELIAQVGNYRSPEGVRKFLDLLVQAFPPSAG